MPREFTESLIDGFRQSMDLVGDPLVEERTKFQDLMIFDSTHNGRVLILDGVVQLTTRDEDSYSEMLSHVPLFELDSPKHVLIVGGGDGAVAEEVLKHKDIVQVDLAEIDERVIETCKSHFPEVNKTAFEDSRFNINIVDAAEFIKRPESKSKYDLIISDRPDPIGPAEALFSRNFYEQLLEALSPGGVAVFQTGTPFSQADELEETSRLLKDIFPCSGTYLTVTPTYLGGYMALTWASRGFQLGSPQSLQDAQTRYAKSGIQTTYYNDEIHHACFALPQWIKQLVA